MIHSEDYEFEARKDELYLVEKRKQIEVEWQMWEEELNRKPAKIKVSKSIRKYEKNQLKDKPLPF